MLTKHPCSLFSYERLLEYLDSINAEVGDKHRSDNAGWEIAEAIAAVLLEDLRSQVAQSEFFALTLDESKALNHTEYLCQEVVYWVKGVGKKSVYLSFAI